MKYITMTARRKKNLSNFPNLYMKRGYTSFKGLREETIITSTFNAHDALIEIQDNFLIL